MKIYELLDKPEKWCQHHLAEDRHGRRVFPNTSAACKWCLLGAAIICYPNDDEHSVVWGKIADATGANGVTWNDENGRTYADVAALCKKLDV